MSYLKECSSNGNNLDVDLVPRLLNKIRDMLSSAWMYGHELGNCLCDSLRNGGGIDFVISQCISDNDNVKFYCAKLLEQCLTADNRVYVVKNGLEKVVQVACFCTKNAASIEHSRVSTGKFFFFTYGSKILLFFSTLKLFFNSTKCRYFVNKELSSALIVISIFNEPTKQRDLLRLKQKRM